MELTTQILGLLAGVISLTTTVLAVIFKNKNSETLESFQETKIMAKNNSNVINNSPNSTITQTTINNSKTSTSSTSADTDFIGFMVFLIVGVTAVAALYTKHEKTVYFIVIVECLILALLSIFGTLKHNIGIHETILSMLAIFEGIFVPFVFKHIFWVKFVGAEFTKKTNFEDFIERITYIFQNKKYLYYSIFEFLSVAISILVVTYLIFTIGKILFAKRHKDIKMYDYILTLLPMFWFLLAEFFLRFTPLFYSNIN